MENGEKKEIIDMKIVNNPRRHLLLLLCSYTLFLLILVIILGFLIVIQEWDGVREEEDLQFVGEEVEQWAVLVAGSQGWDNYRHQADVCHAFHLLRSRGVPEAPLYRHPILYLFVF